MKKDLFTFSIQEAETLGIECAIVLAASKDLKIPSSTSNETLILLKDKISFLEDQEILMHLRRLIDLKLISLEIRSETNKPSSKKNLYKRIENRAIESNEARADDKEEILKNRLNIYDEQTKPLVPYYKKAELHFEVDGMKSINEISLEIEKIIKVKN